MESPNPVLANSLARPRLSAQTGGVTSQGGEKVFNPATPNGHQRKLLENPAFQSASRSIPLILSANPSRCHPSFRRRARELCRGDASATNSPAFSSESKRDCVPISCRPKKAPSPPSAGWRGTLQRSRQGHRKMQMQYKSTRRSPRRTSGPSIALLLRSGTEVATSSLSIAEAPNRFDSSHRESPIHPVLNMMPGH